MAFPWAPIITAGASLIGGLFGQDHSAKQQEKANETNIAQAREQRAWQRENYQNRHQWEVEDLKKAGLNPILSAHQGGSVGQGATGVVESTAKDMSKNMQLAGMLSQINLAQSASAKNIAQAEKTQAETPGASAKSQATAKSLKGINMLSDWIATATSNKFAKATVRKQNILTSHSARRLKELGYNF